MWSKLGDKLKGSSNIESLKKNISKKTQRTITAETFAILRDVTFNIHCTFCFIVQFIHATYFDCITFFISYL